MAVRQRISRVPETHTFGEYLTSYSLVPYQVSHMPSWIHQLPTTWIHIPYFQRGVSWGVSNLTELMESQSTLLGSIIMSGFQSPSNAAWTSRIPRYYEIVDGLQRFSSGTAVLKAVNDHVFEIQGQFSQYATTYFSRIKTNLQNFLPVVEHNHNMLTSHPRIVIQRQYGEFHSDVNDYIVKELGQNPVDISQKIERLILDRYLAVDMYEHFMDMVEVMHTFMGLNTVRVELGEVDILRTYIVQQGDSAGWDPTETGDIENQISEVFISNSKPDTILIPLVNSLRQLIESDEIGRILSTWRGSSLDLDEIEGFLDFVGSFKALLVPSSSTTQASDYLREICACGRNSVGILMGYYFREYNVNNNPPQFIAGNPSSGELEELHKFLVASYLTLLNKRLAKASSLITEALIGTDNLSQIADKLTDQFAPHRLGSTPDRNWLRGVVSQASKKTSKYIFNAMCLPEHNQGTNWGSGFHPLVFGLKRVEFAIDHLIPDSTLNSGRVGYKEGNTIRNFAPLQGSLNNQAKRTPCSEKLLQRSIYRLGYHPYVDWLLDIHAPHYRSTPDVLDDQTRLSGPSSIGEERIDHIVDSLMTRL